MAPEVIMSLQYDAKAGEFCNKFVELELILQNCFRSLVARHYRVSVLNWKSSIPSSYASRAEKFLREECKPCSEVNFELPPSVQILLIILIVSRIPIGTTPELKDLLFGLLRRNSKERMPFDIFFNHSFLQRNPLNQQQQAAGEKVIVSIKSFIFTPKSYSQLIYHRLSLHRRIPILLQIWHRLHRIIITTSTTKSNLVSFVINFCRF